jgi:quercetin dioxygenase-like cupin family protein
MSLSGVIRWTVFALGGVMLLVAPVGSAQQAPVISAPPLVDAVRLRMQPEQGIPGAMQLRIFGAPERPGMYVYRNRFAKGNTSRPHYHDQDRWVTVIQGTWWTAEGDVFQPEKMVPIRAGGFMFHPKGAHHYDGAKDEDTIVQIMGMGPVVTVQTEVDAQGRPTGTNPLARGRGAAAPR